MSSLNPQFNRIIRLFDELIGVWLISIAVMQIIGLKKFGRFFTPIGSGRKAIVAVVRTQSGPAAWPLPTIFWSAIITIRAPVNSQLSGVLRTVRPTPFVNSDWSRSRDYSVGSRKVRYKSCVGRRMVTDAIYRLANF